MEIVPHIHPTAQAMPATCSYCGCVLPTPDHTVCAVCMALVILVDGELEPSARQAQAEKIIALTLALLHTEQPLRMLHPYARAMCRGAAEAVVVHVGEQLEQGVRS
jgi:hypothetical protein